MAKRGRKPKNAGNSPNTGLVAEHNRQMAGLLLTTIEVMDASNSTRGRYAAMLDILEGMFGLRVADGEDDVAHKMRVLRSCERIMESGDAGDAIPYTPRQEGKSE